MREVGFDEIKNTVRELCIAANRELPCSLEKKMRECAAAESGEPAASIMGDICENLDAARDMCLPICQDTGMAVVFVELGRGVCLDCDIYEAVNAGVREGYLDGLLRCSVVADPLRRKNTGDNTPAVIHLSLTEGEKIKIMLAPKGFGSENMSAIKMFTPSATKEDIISFVAETVREAGGNPCPPVVLGVGIGGDFEKCAELSKRALCRNIATRNPEPFYARLEEEMLDAVNATGIGPQGFGGKTTALAVNVEYFPTHIAGLPVAVNVGCHVTRHMSAVI